MLLIFICPVFLFNNNVDNICIEVKLCECVCACVPVLGGQKIVLKINSSTSDP